MCFPVWSRYAKPQVTEMGVQVPLGHQPFAHAAMPLVLCLSPMRRRLTPTSNGKPGGSKDRAATRDTSAGLYLRAALVVGVDDGSQVEKPLIAGPWS